MLKWMLDTNIVSSLINDAEGMIGTRLLRAGPERVGLSMIVAAELRYGAERKRSAQLTRRIDATLSEIAVLPWEPPADRRYGEIRATLERAGALIGPNDLLIAAHALALDLILVTANVRKFSRVPGLKLENWLD